MYCLYMAYRSAKAVRDGKPCCISSNTDVMPTNKPHTHTRTHTHTHTHINPLNMATGTQRKPEMRCRLFDNECGQFHYKIVQSFNYQKFEISNLNGCLSIAREICREGRVKCCRSTPTLRHQTSTELTQDCPTLWSATKTFRRHCYNCWISCKSATIAHYALRLSYRNSQAKYTVVYVNLMPKIVLCKN